MRLTNVAQMALPPGTLQSFGVRVAAPLGRALTVSFDQRRHVGAGDRPGSWMAVAFRIPLESARDDVERAWMSVVARHGALNTAFSRADDAELVLTEALALDGEWSEHPVADGGDPREVLRAVLDQACTPFSRPSHRLVLVTPTAQDGADARPMVVVASDHSHVDMWSLLVLARDLRAALDDPDLASDAAVPSFAEHSAALERMPPAPDAVTQRWRAILDEGQGLMPRFPLPLGDVSEPRPEVVEVRDVLDSSELTRFERRAGEHGVRPTALALSVLTEVTRALADVPLRAVFPVHSRHEPRWYDSVGWFITNSVIECRVPTPEACAAAVKEALALGSHPLAPILAPYGGMPETPGMFAISWLDSRRLPPVPDDLSIQYVSAVVRTDGVMVWFIVNGAGLHLRCRYPDTPEARESLGLWLDRVQEGIRAVAG
jgi:hypothetical protein